MYAGISTKLRISSAVLLAAAIAFAGLPGSYDTVSAQEPVSPGSIDATDSQALFDEKAAQSIDGMLMCPVCPSQTIDQAQVPIAKHMRRLVREKLSQGESREQVLAYFASVYGAGILAAPSKSGFNLLAWTVPVVGVFGALAAGFFVLRSMSARPAGSLQTAPETAGGTDSPENLAPYLQAVDRDLGITESPGSKETHETSTETSTETGGEPNEVEDRMNRGANG